ncbi:MAG: hypothetical protein SFU98_15990 [Leptospiraceae bacterium]|nr:hypothetical protein [Leptospiraceae bacterium]
MHPTVINLNYSLITSFFAGIGFACVLFFAPEKNGNLLKKKQFFPSPSVPIQFEDPKDNSNFKKESNTEANALDLNLLPRNEKANYYSHLQITKAPFEFFQNDSRNLNYSTENNLSFTNENYINYSDGNLKISGIIDPIAQNYYRSITVNNYQGTDWNQFQLQPRNMSYRNIDLNYQVTSSIQANLRANGTESFGDERIKVVPSTLAGLSFTGIPFLQAGFMTGELRNSNSQVYKYSSPSATNPLSYVNKENEILNRELGRKNIFEVTTSVVPSKYLQFQTSVYNLNGNTLNELGGNEGARVSMNVGYRFVMLNIKYNYSSDNFMRTGFRLDSGQSSRDFAGFGITLFLDKYNLYSVYLGNNYHNLVTQGRYSEALGAPPVSSFSASLRGQSTSTNATFFLNFRNQASRDQFFSNLGMIRVPVYSLVNFEYATSMGMELSF